MSEFKPCPFCKSGAHTFHGWLWHVACDDCGCKLTGFVTEAEAIEEWNTRAEQTCHMEQIPECRYDDIECDECGVALWAFSMDMRGEGIYATPNYCPYCGARVEGLAE